MIGAILSFLSGPLLGKVADIINKRSDAKVAQFNTGTDAGRQLAQSYVDAEVRARQVQAEVAGAEAGWWVTRLIKPMIMYPIALHFGAVCWVSTFPSYGWKVFALPAPMDQWEAAAVLTYVGATTVGSQVSKVAAVFLGKR